MTFPIPEHKTWEIMDSSKLSTAYTCWRKLFYSYLLGWKKDLPEHDLYFGESWHRAREYMLIHGYDDIQGAFEAFESYYRQEFDEDTDDLYKPKNPDGVFLALIQFRDHYINDLRDNKVLFTEISGTVPIDERRVLHFRMDSVMENRNSGRIFSWDHKSTKRLSSQWENNFFLSVQTGTYTHCLYCMYPIELVKGIEYCGTAFEFLQRNSKNRSAGYHVSFLRVPAWKSQEQMNTWLWNTVDCLNTYEEELDRLSHCKEGDRVMMAFPLNPESCTKYYGCEFHDFCMSWPNPLQHAFSPPLGFRTSWWNPAEIKTTNKMELKWRG